MSTSWPCPVRCAGQERQQHPLRGERAGDDIANRDAEAIRWAISRAGDAHQAALGLNHRVVAGFLPSRSRLTEARDGTVDQRPVSLRERGVIEAHPGQRSRPEVLDEHVALRDEPIENGAPVRRLEVQGDAFLVAVDAEKIRALAADERRAPAARVVAAARLLDLDDAGAHVREHHRAVRARQDPGQIEHGHAVEWRSHMQGMLNCTLVVREQQTAAQRRLLTLY